MGCIEYESYFFRDMEWNILLSALGVGEWYGFWDTDVVSKPDQGEFHAVLAGLYQRHVVDWQGEGVVVRPPYARLFLAVLESRKCVTVRGNRGIPLRCCYIGKDSVTVMERSQREKGTLCVFSLSKVQCLQMILEGSGLVEGVREEDGGEGPSVDVWGDVFGTQTVLTLTLSDSRNGAVRARMEVQEMGLQTALALQENGIKRTISYQRNWLAQHLGEWMQWEMN